MTDQRTDRQRADAFIDAAVKALAARGLLARDPAFATVAAEDPQVAAQAAPAFTLTVVSDEKRPAGLTCYRTGRVSIGGPSDAADALCGALAAEGLLLGWSEGSRGAGVRWFVPGANAAPAPAKTNIKATLERGVHQPDDGRLEPIIAWLEQLARAGQRSAGGDLLCMTLAAYAGPDGWHGAYRAVAVDLDDLGFRAEWGAEFAAELLELNQPCTGGAAFIRSLGTVGFVDGRLEVRARELDGALEHEVDAGAVYWLRRALRPDPAGGAPW